MKKIFRPPFVFAIVFCLCIILASCSGCDSFLPASCSGCDSFLPTSCSGCNHQETHTIKEKEIAATCTTDGSYDEVVICSECNREISRVAKTVNKNAHTPDAAVTENVIEATCAVEGSYDEVLYCKDCSTEISRVTKTVAMLEHTPKAPVRENLTTTSCTEIGSYDEVVYCNDCGEEISREQKATTGEHTFVGKDFNVKACGVEGTLTVKFCSVCKTFATLDKTVLHAHEFERKTDLEEGKTWFECKLCGLKITNDDSEVYYFLYSGCDLETYFLKEPTCTEEGKCILKCKDCGYILSMTIPALGHDWNDGNTIKEATCIENGEKYYTCKRCGEHYTDFPSGTHNWNEGEVIDESTSCLDLGIERFTCLICNDTIDVNFYAPHDFSEWECIQKETCTVIGIYRRTCSVCGKEEEDKVNPSHDFEVIEYKKETCTDYGYKISKCAKCGLIDFDYYDSLGHNLVYHYDNDYHWHECTRCSYDEKNYKDAHTLELTVKTKETDDGTQLKYIHVLKDICTICDYENVYGTSELHVHYAVEIIETEPPTCTAPGNILGLKCAVPGCEEILIQPEYTEPYGHSWENCNCTRCGETQLKMQLSADGTYYIVIGMGEYAGSVLDIPTVYKELPVKEIASSAFSSCTSIECVITGNTITSIPSDAFSFCTNLESATIGNSVTSIGNSAFFGCSSLKSATIGNSVTSINKFAFDACSSLESITISDSVTSISEWAFADCRSLNSVTIGSNVTSISFGAFSGCFTLTNVVIPNNVTFIDAYAFGNCTSLINIAVSENNSSYKDIDGNLYTKDAKTFIQYATGKKNSSFTIPDSVTSIGDYAFSRCYNLESVIIGNGVTSIGSHAFAVCTKIESIAIPDRVTSIGFSAFSNCSALEIITIGNSVTSIGEQAFRACTSLENITIPNSITFIDSSAFSNCTSLKYNEYENAYYLGNENNPYVILIKAKNTSITNCTIHNDTKIICSYAFNGCSSLDSITIPDSATFIGYSSFYNCTSLERVTISNSVTSIDNYVFYNCSSLTDVYYTGTEEEWSAINIGVGNTNLTGATIHYNWVEE